MITTRFGRLRFNETVQAYRPDEIGRIEAWIADRRDKEGWNVLEIPSCQCCGEYAGVTGDSPNFRCEKHRERNPCAIEGCRCTMGWLGSYSNDHYLCAKHWRPLTDAADRRQLSELRKRWRVAVQREADIVARDLARNWWIAFNAIVEKARSRSAGDVDMTEINKMFGWDE